MKACLVCGEVKPLDDYHRDSNTRSGRRTRCKVCLSVYKKNYYRANREVQVAYARQYRKEHPGRAAESMRRSRAANPEISRANLRRYRERHPDRVRKRNTEYRNRNKDKVNAREAVHRAIRLGDLTPATECERCAHDFSVYRRESHHADYSKRLEVEWLCALCHKRHHREAA